MLEGEQKYERWSNLVNSEVNLVFTEWQSREIHDVRNFEISQLWERSVGFYQLPTALWISTLTQNSNPD